MSLLALYEEKYGRYNLVTPAENKKVSSEQREGVFENIELAYKKAGIELVNITVEELSKLRKKQ